MTSSPCLQKLKKPPMWVAVHEAAHAVAAVLLGKELGWEWIPVHELAVFSTPKPNGEMGYAVTDFGYSTLDDVDDAKFDERFFEEDEATAAIVGLLAGPLAEARHRRKAEGRI